MPVLIDKIPVCDYPLTGTSTLQVIPHKGKKNLTSTYQISEYDTYGLNGHAFRILNEIQKLPDNWDEEGGIAPSKRTYQRAHNLAVYLQQTGEKIYNVAPGPNGEIMIDLRDKGNSVEILFYPEKKKFVFFPVQGRPVQDEFSLDKLPEILKMLHGQSHTGSSL